MWWLEARQHKSAGQKSETGERVVLMKDMAELRVQRLRCMHTQYKEASGGRAFMECIELTKGCDANRC